MTDEISFRPQAGPQERFDRCAADIAMYGGSAGSGKSQELVYLPTRWIDNPDFRGAIARKTYPELMGSRSVWEYATQIYRPLGASMPTSPSPVARFPSGAQIDFIAMDSDSDVHKYQSKAWDYIALDEASQFTDYQFWYMQSRLRGGRRCLMRGATNPDVESYLRPLVDWWLNEEGYPIPWRSGVIRWLARIDEQIVWAATRKGMQAIINHRTPDDENRPEPISFTMISAKLEDNPALTKKDPRYAARLATLPLVERLRLRGGNWNIRAMPGNIYKREWFEIVEAAPASVLKRVRAWDKAGTEVKKTKTGRTSKAKGPAWTVGTLMSMTKKREIYIEDVVRFRGSPATVEKTIENTATLDGKSVEIAIWQDPGQAGKADVDNLVRLLQGYRAHGEPAREDKVTYALPLSAQAERGNVKVVRGDWNKAWLDEHEGFPDGKFKDQPDSSSLGYLRMTKKRALGGMTVPGAKDDVEPHWSKNA